MPAIALLVIGVGVGSFGTLVGAGGGFLLVPLLALLEPAMPPQSVTAVSLAVVAMNATSGAIAYYRQRRIDFHSGIPFALATLPGSVAGVILTRFVSRTLFDGIFAALLIALAVFVFLSHEDEPTSAPEGGGWGHVLRRLTDASGVDYHYRVNPTSCSRSWRRWARLRISPVATSMDCTGRRHSSASVRSSGRKSERACRHGSTAS